MRHSIRSAGLWMILGFTWLAYGWTANFTEITKPYFILLLNAIFAAIMLLFKENKVVDWSC